jgi:signal transduction histidine kinase/ActR/RegA family two-component response regulator
MSDRSSKALAQTLSGSTLPVKNDAAFNTVFDTSAEALLVVSPEGVIHRANARAKSLLRLSESGGSPADLRQLLSPASSDQLPYFFKAPGGRQKLDTALPSGISVRLTLRAALPPAGSLPPGPVDLLLCLEEGSVVQRAEAKWRQLEAELRSVLDSVDAGVMLYDSAGSVRFLSIRFGELFGLHARALEAITHIGALNEAISGRFRDPELYLAPWRAFVQGAFEPVHDELEIIRPKRRVLERFSRPVLDNEGHATGWIELVTDVTAKRQIQSAMLQTEKMAALGQLVSGIAHELNNPLTSITGYAQLLLGHGLTPPQLAEAKKVNQEAERARRIVKNLLYFARENKPERLRVSINEIIEKALALRGYELKLENIAIECALDPALPPTMADPYQLQQVILNLVVNAEQAIVEGHGKGKIRVRTQHLLEGRSLGPRDRILLEVVDDGPGIPRDTLSRIFDPFFTTKPPGVGTGLGLSIVYGIVHQHGGNVAVENLPEGGVKFSVELPILAVSTPTRESKHSKAAPATAIPRRRILAIEDEPTVAQLIADVLREEGHTVEAVLDSQEGLSRISRGHYDLVICDLRMPRLDGAALFESLVRAGSPLRDRILFITGDTLSARTLGFLEKNNVTYLAKPFLVEELKIAVARLLEAHDAKRPASGTFAPGAADRTVIRAASTKD